MLLGASLVIHAHVTKGSGGAGRGGVGQGGEAQQESQLQELAGGVCSQRSHEYSLLLLQLCNIPPFHTSLRRSDSSLPLTGFKY